MRQITAHSVGRVEDYDIGSLSRQRNARFVEFRAIQLCASKILFQFIYNFKILIISVFSHSFNLCLQTVTMFSLLIS